MKSFSAGFSDGGYDAIVIGASVNGMAAAALLARAGAQVLLVERELSPTESPGALYALDPVLVTELGLTRKGLAYKTRDLPLVGLGEGAAPLVLGRNPHAAARALETLGEADAKAWPAFRREWFAQGRRLRRWWWHAHQGGRAEDTLPSARSREAFMRLAYTGADAYLAARFESEALRALLMFDAVAGGFSPSEPGSALALVWRGAQEMAGLQAAQALPACGSLIAALTRASRAADLRMAAPVTRILIKNGEATGVALEDGTEIKARMLLSAISTTATEKLLRAPHTELAQVGEAQLVLRTSGMPEFPMPFNTGRMIIADNAGVYADAYEAARAGNLPCELPLECVAAGDRLIVTARPVPAQPRGGWEALRPLLAARVVKAVNSHAPGFARAITGVEFRLPKAQPRAGLAHLLAPPAARLKSRWPNLLLCGRDAEPVPSVSGRAGRMAAALAARSLQEPMH
jgi:phytoene dehydrogenase-like protein